MTIGQKQNDNGSKSGGRQSGGLSLTVDDLTRAIVAALKQYHKGT